MKTDLLYAIKDNLRDTRELLYSLRSVAKNLRGVGRIFIVSNKLPPGIDPEKVTLIEATDCQAKKDMNILWKILCACRDERLSERFLFINDDHFILQPTEASEIPPYNKGTLSDAASKRRNEYTRRLANTARALLKRGYRETHFDIHTPILYEEQKFIEMADAFPWQKGEGFVVKSLYGNYHRFPADHRIPDCKISQSYDRHTIERKIAGRFCFSTSEAHITRHLLDVFDKYCGTEPSPWEQASILPMYFLVKDVPHFRRIRKREGDPVNILPLGRSMATGLETGIVKAETLREAMSLQAEGGGVELLTAEEYCRLTRQVAT